MSVTLAIANISLTDRISIAALINLDTRDRRLARAARRRPRLEFSLSGLFSSSESSAEVSKAV